MKDRERTMVATTITATITNDNNNDNNTDNDDSNDSSSNSDKKKGRLVDLSDVSSLQGTLLPLSLCYYYPPLLISAHKLPQFLTFHDFSTPPYQLPSVSPLLFLCMIQVPPLRLLPNYNPPHHLPLFAPTITSLLLLLFIYDPGAPPSAIIELLSRLRVRYGSVVGYLDSIGFTAEYRQKLRQCAVIASSSSTSRPLSSPSS